MKSSQKCVEHKYVYKKEKEIEINSLLNQKSKKRRGNE